MRRAAAVLLTTVLTAGGVAGLAAPASADDIVPKALTITVTNLGPEHRTCSIDADLYIPAGATSAHRAPALLVTNGFGGTKADQAALAQGFGDHGYVTLSYTGIGFVDHDTCPITLDDREHDGVAASQLISFLGGNPSIVARDANGHRVYVDQVIRQDAQTGTKFDPAVGMTGGSYGGQIQFATAAVEHEKGLNRLDAIIPLITWNDLAYSLAPENSSLPGGTARSGTTTYRGTGVFKYQWAGLFTTVGVADGTQDLVPSPVSTPDLYRTFVTQGCANFDKPVCRALLDVASLGYPSKADIAFLHSNSVASYMKDVQVPTMLGQGEDDTLFNLQESVATYTSLKRQGTPVSLVWQSWGHSHSAPQPGELDMRHPASSYQGAEALAWFDHYVRKTGPAPTLNFQYYRDWAYTASGGNIHAAYATAPAYPIGTTKTWFLSGSSAAGADGSLVGSRGAITPGTSLYSSSAPIGPNYTETSGVDQSKPVTDPAGSAIRFATAPLINGLNVVGSPRLTVQLDAPAVALSQAGGPAGQLVVFAKLYDVGPDGTIALPDRLISPARVTDVTKPVTIELPAIVHQFAPGHRLVVVLAGGDLAYRGSTAPQQVTLTTGGAALQKLTLPVAG